MWEAVARGSLPWGQPSLYTCIESSRTDYTTQWNPVNNKIYMWICSNFNKTFNWKSVCHVFVGLLQGSPDQVRCRFYNFLFINSTLFWLLYLCNYFQTFRTFLSSFNYPYYFFQLNFKIIVLICNYSNLNWNCIKTLKKW